MCVITSLFESESLLLYLTFFFFLFPLFTGYPWCRSLDWYRHWIRIHNSSRTWPDCSLFIHFQVRHHISIEMVYRIWFFFFGLLLLQIGEWSRLGRDFCQMAIFYLYPRPWPQISDDSHCYPRWDSNYGCVLLLSFVYKKKSSYSYVSFIIQVLILVLVPNSIPSTLKLDWVLYLWSKLMLSTIG